MITIDSLINSVKDGSLVNQLARGEAIRMRDRMNSMRALWFSPVEKLPALGEPIQILLYGGVYPMEARILEGTNHELFFMAASGDKINYGSVDRWMPMPVVTA